VGEGKGFEGGDREIAASNDTGGAVSGSIANIKRSYPTSSMLDGNVSSAVTPDCGDATTQGIRGAKGVRCSEKLLGGDIDLTTFTAAATLGIDVANLNVTPGVEGNIATILGTTTGINCARGNRFSSVDDNGTAACSRAIEVTRGNALVVAS
jgi:hypothetical protein